MAKVLTFCAKCGGTTSNMAISCRVCANEYKEPLRSQHISLGFFWPDFTLDVHWKAPSNDPSFQLRTFSRSINHPLPVQKLQNPHLKNILREVNDSRLALIKQLHDSLFLCKQILHDACPIREIISLSVFIDQLAAMSQLVAGPGQTSCRDCFFENVEAVANLVYATHWNKQGIGFDPLHKTMIIDLTRSMCSVTRLQQQFYHVLETLVPIRFHDHSQPELPDRFIAVHCPKA